MSSKNHKHRTKQETLVNYAIAKAMSLSLLITLTILWDQAEWPTDGLEEFIDRYWEWIDAYNNNEGSIVELVEAMKKDTGIEVKL